MWQWLNRMLRVPDPEFRCFIGSFWMGNNIFSAEDEVLAPFIVIVDSRGDVHELVGHT
jgi:hypothetical protein